MTVSAIGTRTSSIEDAIPAWTPALVPAIAAAKARAASGERLNLEQERLIALDVERRYNDTRQVLHPSDVETGQDVAVDGRVANIIASPVKEAGVWELMVKWADTGRSGLVVLSSDSVLTAVAGRKCGGDLDWEGGITSGGEAEQQLHDEDDHARFVSANWSRDDAFGGYFPQRAARPSSTQQLEAGTAW